MTTSGLPFSCEPSATPAVSHSEPGQAGLYATAVDGIYRYHVRQGHLTLIWHALFKAPPDRVLTPVTVSDDEAFFGEDSDHGFFVDALNTVDGHVLWRTPITGSEVSNLFIEQQTVYIETDGPAEGQVTVHAFNSQDGTQRWSQTFTTSNLCTAHRC